MERFTVVKINEKYGYIDIPSKKYYKDVTLRGMIVTEEAYTLNKVILEDGLIRESMDEELEVIDDERSREFIKEVNDRLQ